MIHKVLFELFQIRNQASTMSLHLHRDQGWQSSPQCCNQSGMVSLPWTSLSAHTGSEWLVSPEPVCRHTLAVDARTFHLPAYYHSHCHLPSAHSVSGQCSYITIITKNTWNKIKDTYDKNSNLHFEWAMYWGTVIPRLTVSKLVTIEDDK